MKKTILKKIQFIILFAIIVMATSKIFAQPYIPDTQRELDLKTRERQLVENASKKRKLSDIQMQEQKLLAESNKQNEKGLWDKIAEFRAKFNKADFDFVPTPLRKNLWLDLGYNMHYEYDSNPFWIKSGRRDAHALVMNPFLRTRYFGRNFYLENLYSFEHKNYLGTLSGNYNQNNHYNKFMARYNYSDDVSIGLQNTLSAGDSSGKIKEQYIYNRTRTSLKWQIDDKWAIDISPYASVFHDTSIKRTPVSPDESQGYFYTKSYHNYSDFNDVGADFSALYEPHHNFRFTYEQGIYYRNFWNSFANDYVASKSIVGAQWNYLRSIISKDSFQNNNFITKSDVSQWKITALGGVEARGYLNTDNQVEHLAKLSSKMSFFNRNFQIMARYKHDVDDTVVLPGYVPFKAFDSFGDIDSLLDSPAALLTLNRDYEMVKFDDCAIQTAVHLIDKKLTIANAFGFRFNDYVNDRVEFTNGTDREEKESLWYVKTGIRYRFNDWLSADATHTYIGNNNKNDNRGVDFKNHIFSAGISLWF